jgi:hypothetical protein
MISCEIIWYKVPDAGAGERQNHDQHLKCPSHRHGDGQVMVCLVSGTRKYAFPTLVMGPDSDS